MEKEWFTDDEAAKWLSVPLEVIQEAIRAGQLPVLHLGSHIRINRDVVLKLASGGMTFVEPETANAPDVIDNRIPVPQGMQWIEELVPVPPFPYKWPKKKEKPDDQSFIITNYSPGWQGKISLEGKIYTVLIGQTTTSHHSEKLEVFLNGASLCGFSQTLDGQEWASLIKPDGRRTLRADETPPSLYRQTKVESYRDVTGMTGSGVPHAAAVVIRKDDMISATHHAAARWLGRNHLPVKPTS